MLKVTKFGGSSLCDSAGFARVREIVLADPARRVVVVSAAGKRHAADHKITDLLYLCHAHLQYEVSCWDLWRRVADRYREIRDGCALTLPIEAELEAIYAAMDRRTPRDWIVSRGEYLSARLMADLLGFDFVDAKDWLLFDAAGRVRPAASYAALGSLADGRKIVTPGFYGALPDGQIHTLPRGGSDVTGALAAAALHADLYENWTDVPGVLAADPALVQRAQIPLRICSTLEPETPGTLVRTQLEPGVRQICFAGRRQLALLRLTGAEEGLAALCRQAEIAPFSLQSVCGETAAILPMAPGSEALHRLQEQAQQTLQPKRCTLRENLSVLAALCRSTASVPALVQAVESGGVPVHLLLKCGECVLLLVNDSQYEQALRAAYAASRQLRD